jgi:hypothetical protein
MKIKMSLVLGIMFSFLLITTGIVFSEEQTQQNPPTQVTQPTQPTQPTQEIPSEPETQWIWGEVVSVDTAAKKILVKYLDYETDTEKEINIDVDDKTTYENVKSVDEIKPQDTLSIDYIINPDGRNIAKNISIEKPEGAQTLPEETPKEEPKAVPGLE